MTSIIGKIRNSKFEIRNCRTAFTLMEMLVVLAVVVLLLGVSIPFFASFTKGAKLKTAGKDIIGVLNTARSLAITYRKNYSVTFDCSTSPHSYYISDADGRIHEKKYSLPSSIRFYRSQFPETPTTFIANKATFSPRGGLVGSAGAAWLADKKGNFRRISVSNTTGRVKVDKEP